MLVQKTALILVSIITLFGATCQADRAPRREGRVPRPALSASPSATEEVLPTVARRLGPPPGNCPGPYPRRREVAPAYAPLIGARPVWAGMYAEYEPRRHVYRATDAPRTRYGFRVKVLWVMAPNTEESVTISGANLGNSTPLRIEVEDAGAGRATPVTLEPQVAGGGEGGWREFPSYVYFDEAGCFELRASSAEGSWRLRFGFGR
jgi:hypothetical protein